jgi:hypothetical protein
VTPSAKQHETPSAAQAETEVSAPGADFSGLLALMPLW